jgi:xanthine/uracil permease
MNTVVPAVDERLAPARLAALGLRDVLVRHAGAIAAPLIVGWVFKRCRNRSGRGSMPTFFAGGIGRSRDKTRVALGAGAANAERG